MNIIIPMAGMGKRMRPHTLTVPKPLIPIAGKPIVQRLVEDIAKTCPEKIENIGFIIGDFGPEVEEKLLKTAEKVGAKGHIFHQDEALGTAHAVLCARPLLQDKIVIAFADTLFSADFKMDTNKDGIIWVKEVEDPRAFGVVTLDQQGFITGMVEKPEQPVSNLAIIGIYFLKDAQHLVKELDFLMENNITSKGEYQLTDALESLRAQGNKISTDTVMEWFDCGNKDGTVFSNQRVLALNHPHENLISQKIRQENSVIIEPCFIGSDVSLKNAVVGPYVSIGNGTVIENCVVSNSIVQENSQLNNCVISGSMIGNYAKIEKHAENLSLGDYSSCS